MTKRPHPWRRVIQAEIRAVQAQKQRRPRPELRGKAYAARMIETLLSARGSKDLY